MSWDGYMCLGGVEIINSSRLCANLADGRGPEGLECQNCCPCPELDLGLGYAGGYNPTSNAWYDPLEPDSNDFAGLLITSITGLEPGEFVRPLTEAAGIGAVIGAGRQNAPQVVVTGILMASTCCGVDFGFRWLRQALRGSCTSRNLCAGDDLTVLACAPLFPDQDCVGDAAALAECLAQCNGDPQCIIDCNARFAATDFEALLKGYYRTFKNAALIAGPTVTQIIPRGCPACYDCGLTEVQFTLSAGDPCMYAEPQLLADGLAFACQDATECAVFVDNTDGLADCGDCATEPKCGTDPLCVDTDPPKMPSLVNSCYNDCLSDRFCQTCFDIPTGLFPATAEGALQFEVFSGDLPMRRVNIRVWENPLGLPVEELEECAVCTELNVSYVGPNSTLLIDGAARTATIMCPGGTSVRANPFIAGSNGTNAFSYPSLACGGPFTACIRAEDGVSPLAFVNASVVARYC